LKFGQAADNPHRKDGVVTKHIHWILVGAKQWERDKRLGAWNVKSLCSSGSVTTIAATRELRWVFRKWDVGAWTGLSWLSIRTGGGHL